MSASGRISNVVWAMTLEAWERISTHPASICGGFDPRTDSGWVRFPNPPVAQKAKEELL